MSELVKKENSLPVSNDVFSSMLDSAPAMSSRDIMIPKIIVMQGMSPQVLAGEASFGEVRDTMNNEVLACAAAGKKEAKTLKFIPFHHQRFWVIKKLVDEKYTFDKMVDVTSKNENDDPYEVWIDNSDGLYRKRVYLHLFYVLIPGKQIPYTLGFRGASKRAGDSLLTQMYIINKMIQSPDSWKRTPMAKVMELTPVRETKKDNTYIALNVRVDRDSVYEEVVEAYKWWETVKKGDVKVDHSDIANENETVAQVVPESSDF